MSYNRLGSSVFEEIKILETELKKYTSFANHEHTQMTKDQRNKSIEKYTKAIKRQQRDQIKYSAYMGVVANAINDVKSVKQTVLEIYKMDEGINPYISHKKNLIHNKNLEEITTLLGEQQPYLKKKGIFSFSPFNAAVYSTLAIGLVAYIARDVTIQEIISDYKIYMAGIVIALSSLKTNNSSTAMDKSEAINRAIVIDSEIEKYKNHRKNLKDNSKKNIEVVLKNLDENAS